MKFTFPKKIFLLFMMLVTSLILKAQAFDDMDDADLESMSTKKLTEDEEAMDGILDYQPIHFDFQDVILVLLLLFACYVFGKIWKGCSYLIIMLAVLFFFFMR